MNQIISNFAGGLGLVRETTKSSYLEMWGGTISPKLSKLQF